MAKKPTAKNKPVASGSLIGISRNGKAFFNPQIGVNDGKPFLAAQDSTGRIVCFEGVTQAKMKETAQQLKDQGFKILLGSS